MNKFALALLITTLLISDSFSAKKDTPRKTRKPRRDKYQPSETEYIKEDSLRFQIVPSEDFDKQMENFNLDFVHNVMISPKDTFEYSFDVEVNNGDFVWITYLVKDEVDFEFGIIDRENGSVLFSNSINRDFMGKLLFEKSERLKVYFNNRSYGSFIRIMIGFECHNCNQNEKLAQKDNVKKTLNTLKQIDSIKSRMTFVSELYKERQSTFLKKMKSSHNNIFYFTIAEIFMVFVINIYQVCSIKNLMSKRTML